MPHIPPDLPDIDGLGDLLLSVRVLKSTRDLEADDCLPTGLGLSILALFGEGLEADVVRASSCMALDGTGGPVVGSPVLQIHTIKANPVMTALSGDLHEHNLLHYVPHQSSFLSGSVLATCT